jgi:hypothetical protein
LSTISLLVDVDTTTHASAPSDPSESRSMRRERTNADVMMLLGRSGGRRVTS